MTDRPSVVGVVPMKGHSERVPRKNLRPLAGRTLYHWVVDALLGAETITRVVVDTDSDEIAADVRDHFPGVEVIMRPEHLHGDLVPMHDVLRHDASVLSEDLLLQTHSTNPLLLASTIDAAVEVFVSSVDHDSLFSVTELRTRLFWPDGEPINHDPAVLLRTQDLPPVLEENSNIYLISRERLLRTGLRVGDRPLLFPMPALEAVDIDEEIDFLVAERLMEARLDA